MSEDDLRKTVEELDWLVVQQNAKIQDLAARKNGTYSLRASDIQEFAKAAREIADGDVSYGLKRMTDMLDEIDAQWRKWI
jgi:hypothetical protein